MAMTMRILGRLAAILLLCLSSHYALMPVNHFPLREINSNALCRGNYMLENQDVAEDDGRQQKVVVIGGGVGGLAVASRIASSNTKCKVTLLEKNEFVGGRCGSFQRKVAGVGSFRHERGPSLLLLQDVYRDVFRDCVDQLPEDFGLHMAQCVPAYKVVFEDGDSIEVGFPRKNPPETAMEAEVISRQKMNEFEQEGAAKWDEYMRATSAFLDCGLPNFIEERLDLTSFPTFMIEALRDFAKSWPLKPHSDVLDSVFSSEKMKALASFQDLYVGLEPYRNQELIGGGVFQSTAPAVFGLLAAIELHPSNSKSGVFAPIGGFQKVSQALQRLAESQGVDIQCNRMVTDIDEAGIIYKDLKDPEGPTRLLSADLIIVNADLPYATRSLLSPTKASGKATSIFDWDNRFSFSSGVISFHWSIDQVLGDLNTHNVFMMAGSQSQAQASWKVLRDNEGDTSTDSPFNFYVHRPTKTDPTAAPTGCDSIMVLVPCRTLLRDEDCSRIPREEALEIYKLQFSDTVVARAREAVLARLGALPSLQNLKDHILDEVVDTPATWADQFHLAAGTPFALSHGFGQLSVTRPGHEFQEQPNVLFCGASTKPGNGVPLVLISAKQVAERAAQKLQQ